MPRKPFIAEPRRVNPLLRPFNALVDRAAGHRFVPARLMSWDSRTAFSWVGGSLYWLFPVGRVRKGLGERLLDMVAITTAYAVGSPYCVWDTAESGPTGLSEGELEAIRTGADPAELPSLSPRERLAIRYARLISATPLEFPEDFIAELRSGFDEQEIVVLAALSAEVNRNARLFEALGAPPPGTRTGG
ncbi:MAG TPA: hypothetical protein VFL69_00935 [Marmoricola sp.]|nr:hypothetical protein [Marmoricola sp.]